MEDIEYRKLGFQKAFEALPVKMKKKVLTYFDCKSIYYLVGNAKAIAKGVMEYADSKGYGYGECYFYLNEETAESMESFPELFKPYKMLVHAYYEFLIEVDRV